jgi:hypothetical protein
VTDDVRPALAVALEHGLPFTGLRGFAADPRLFHYVPRDAAVARCVVPVVLVGDTLKLASATPDPELADVRARFPALRVEVVVAPRSAVEAALARAPAEAED